MIHTVFSVQNNRAYFYGTYKKYQEASDRLDGIIDAMRDDGFVIDQDHQITCHKIVPGILWNGVNVEHVGYLGIHSAPIVLPQPPVDNGKQAVNVREQMMSELKRKLQEFSFGLQTFVEETSVTPAEPETEGSTQEYVPQEKRSEPEEEPTVEPLV